MLHKSFTRQRYQRTEKTHAALILISLYPFECIISNFLPFTRNNRFCIVPLSKHSEGMTDRVRDIEAEIQCYCPCGITGTMKLNLTQVTN